MARTLLTHASEPNACARPSRNFGDIHRERPMTRGALHPPIIDTDGRVTLRRSCHTLRCRVVTLGAMLTLDDLSPPEPEMDFSFDAVMDAPIDQVMPLLRDRLVELVPYLDTVDAIEEVSRDVDGPEVKIVNAWQGNSKGLPAFAKPFMTKAMTSWVDHATWNAEARTIAWRFEPHKMKTLYDCGGVNRLEDLGDGRTKLVINGSLVVNPTKFPRMVRRLIPKLERWAINRIKPNLAEMPRAVQSFLVSGQPPS